MIGEKSLGERIAKRLEDYGTAWGKSAATLPENQRERRLIAADVLKVVAMVIRDVTQ